MNTILFVSSGVVLVLVILAKIPGLEHTVKPLIDLLFTGIKLVLENAVSWFIWLFKLLLDAHLSLVTNLIFSDRTLDPSVAIKEKAAS